MRPNGFLLTLSLAGVGILPLFAGIGCSSSRHYSNDNHGGESSGTGGASSGGSANDGLGGAQGGAQTGGGESTGGTGFDVLNCVAKPLLAFGEDAGLTQTSVDEYCSAFGSGWNALPGGSCHLTYDQDAPVKSQRYALRFTGSLPDDSTGFYISWNNTSETTQGFHLDRVDGGIYASLNGSAGGGLIEVGTHYEVVFGGATPVFFSTTGDFYSSGEGKLVQSLAFARTPSNPGGDKFAVKIDDLVDTGEAPTLLSLSIVELDCP